MNGNKHYGYKTITCQDVSLWEKKKKVQGLSGPQTQKRVINKLSVKNKNQTEAC